MIDINKWHEILHTLSRNKFRTIMTAFGIFWGLFILMVLTGAGNGLQNGVMKSFDGVAFNSVCTWPMNTTLPYRGFSPNRQWFFSIKNKEVLEERVPGIKMVCPTVHGGGWLKQNLATRVGRNSSFRVDGVYPEHKLAYGTNVTGGRFISHLDIENTRKVAVVGKAIVEELYEPEEEPVGSLFQVQGISFLVIGTFESLRGGGWGRYENSMIYMPFSTVNRIFNYGDRVNNFTIVAHDHVSASSIIDECQGILAMLNHVLPADKQAFGTDNREKEYRKTAGLFLGVRTLVWIVGIGTLLAGVIGVSNIMLIIIKERTSEIGIQRAIGATPWKIINQVITESLFLTLVAGLFGLSAGIGIIELVNKGLANVSNENMMFHQPEVSLQVAMVCLIVMVFMGLIAGLLPAWRAVKVKPVEAIRG